MRLKVVTPVGHGHEQIVKRCMETVQEAIRNQTIWSSVTHHVLMDDGRGRSATRNLGMTDADWFFLIDADDEMLPDALNRVDLSTDATFGAIQLEGRITPENKYPCSFETIRKQGARGTLSMGCFVRNTGIKFNEDLDRGEDFEFYLRLKSFTKLSVPLVNITRYPSAVGPRGYKRIDWVKECDRVIRRYAVLE